MQHAILQVLGVSSTGQRRHPIICIGAQRDSRDVHLGTSRDVCLAQHLHACTHGQGAGG